MIRSNDARRDRRLLVLATFCLTMAAAQTNAQLPSTQLATVSPAGGKQGTTFEVQVTGKDLRSAERLLFSHPKITGKAKIETPEHLMTPRHVDDKFDVTIAPDVLPGIYEVRVVGRNGTSNPRAFAVGRFDEESAAGKNRSRDSAHPASIGKTYNGACNASGVDYYRLPLKANQRVLIDCLAERIDSRLDGTLIVYDGDGAQLARNRDTVGRDSLIDFTAPADGEYVVGVYDYLYRGGAEYFYRLTIHSAPHVDFVFPPSGEPGTNASYTVYGRNLPGGTPAEGVSVDGIALESITANIAIPPREKIAPSSGLASRIGPRTALVAGIDYRLNDSNPVRIGVAHAPVVVEKADNDDPSQAQKVTIPCEYVGQFYPARDEDWIEFEATKGDVYEVEVISHRLGLDSDPTILIQKVVRKEGGEESVSDLTTVDDPTDRAARIGSEFDTSTDDPQYRFKVPENATYRLMVRDQFGDSRVDARYVYRLVIRRKQPDFNLVAICQGTGGGGKKNNNQVLMLPPVISKGGAAMIRVTVDRCDGYDGEINLSVEGLPSDITCPDTIVAGNSKSALLMLSAGSTAAAWSGPIRVLGKATIDGRQVVRTARSGSLVWGTANRQLVQPVFRVVRDMVVSVSGGTPLPASIALGDGNVVETSLGGKIEVPVHVNRQGDFKSDLKMTAVGLPKELKPKDITLKGGANDAKFELAVTNTSVKPGSYSCYLRAEAKHKMVLDPEAVAEAERDIAEVQKVLAALENEIKQATGEDDAAKKRMKKLQDKKKRIESAKKSVEKSMADAKTGSKPKDMTLSLVSTPVTIRIAAAPFVLQAKTDRVVAKQDTEFDIPLQVTKRFGFDDKVNLSLRMPSGVAGVRAGGVSIDKGKADATLKLKLAKTATPGEHRVAIRAESKFNNVTVRTEIPIVVQVDKAG